MSRQFQLSSISSSYSLNPDASSLPSSASASNASNIPSSMLAAAAAAEAEAEEYQRIAEEVDAEEDNDQQGSGRLKPEGVGASYHTATEIDPYASSSAPIRPSLFSSSLLGLSSSHEEVSRNSLEDEAAGQHINDQSPQTDSQEQQESDENVKGNRSTRSVGDGEGMVRGPSSIALNQFNSGEMEDSEAMPDWLMGSFREEAEDDEQAILEQREREAREEQEQVHLRAPAHDDDAIDVDQNDGGLDDRSSDSSRSSRSGSDSDRSSSSSSYEGDEGGDEYDDHRNRRRRSSRRRRRKRGSGSGTSSSSSSEERRERDDREIGEQFNTSNDQGQDVNESADAAPSSLYHSYLAQGVPTLPAYANYSPATPISSHKANPALSYNPHHHYATSSPAGASSPMYGGYSPHHPSASRSPRPSRSFNPTSPRVSHYYGSSNPYGSMSVGASSPRQDTISSVSQRVESLSRSNRLSALLATANKFNQEVAGSGVTDRVVPDYNNFANQNISAAKSSSKQALISIDQHLLRRYIFNVLDSDMIIRGIVQNKSAMGLSITIAEILYPHDKAKEVLLKQFQAAQSMIQQMQNQKEGAGEKASLKTSSAPLHYFPPLSSFLGGIHSNSSATTAVPSTTHSQFTSSIPSSSGTSSANTDPETSYETEKLLFADFEVLSILGECHLAEMQAPGSVKTLDNASTVVSGVTINVSTASLERFSLGDQVKALVISVDIHSEKVYLSMNQNRLRGSVATMHKLGVMSKEQKSDTVTPEAPVPTASTPSVTATPSKLGLLNPMNKPEGFNSAGVGTKPLPSRPAKNGLALFGNALLLAKAKNYLHWLHDQPLFKNPEGVNKLMTCYHINQYGSLNKKVQVDPANHYKALRYDQNQSWAKESVVKGISLAKKGSYDNAMKCYQHALDIDPNFTQAYVARGAAYVLQGALKKAIAEFEQALKIDPQQVYALSYLQAAKDKLMGKSSSSPIIASGGNASTTPHATLSTLSAGGNPAIRMTINSAASTDKSSRKRHRSRDEGLSSNQSHDAMPINDDDLSSSDGSVSSSSTSSSNSVDSSSSDQGMMKSDLERQQDEIVKLLKRKERKEARKQKKQKRDQDPPSSSSSRHKKSSKKSHKKYKSSASSSKKKKRKYEKDHKKSSSSKHESRSRSRSDKHRTPSGAAGSGYTSSSSSSTDRSRTSSVESVSPSSRKIMGSGKLAATSTTPPFQDAPMPGTSGNRQVINLDDDDDAEDDEAEVNTGGRDFRSNRPPQQQARIELESPQPHAPHAAEGSGGSRGTKSSYNETLSSPISHLLPTSLSSSSLAGMLLSPDAVMNTQFSNTFSEGSPPIENTEGAMDLSSSATNQTPPTN